MKFPKHGLYQMKINTSLLRLPPKASALEKKFLLQWAACGGLALALEAEYKFHDKRKWRFDFAHLPTQTAFEIEGILPSGESRHQRYWGFKKDSIKYFEAQLKGWTIFRLTSGQITYKNLIRIVEWIEKEMEK